MTAETPSQMQIIAQERLLTQMMREQRDAAEAALRDAQSERDRWRAVACNVKDGTAAAEAENVRLRGEIEDYLLWEPGRKGHAAAHERLRAALKENT